MKVLVTGATGFVGSHLVPFLLKKNIEVMAQGYQQKPDFKCSNVQGDLRDPAFVTQITKNVEAVIHLAGLMMTQPDQKTDLMSLAAVGTENLVRAFEENHVQKILFTSSTVALGATTDGKILLSEEQPLEPPGWSNFYNVQAKRLAEEILKKSKLDYRITYSGLLYGAGDWKKKIRKANKPILKGKMPFYFSGGVNVNTIESFIDGLWRVFQSSQSRTRTILSGENITNQQFLTYLAESAGKKPPRYLFPSFALKALSALRLSSLNPESVGTLLAYHWCDSSQAQKELGYVPGQARLAIKNSTEWILQNEQL